MTGIQTVERLLRAGASVYSPRRGDGLTPLHVGAVKGNFEVVQALLHATATATPMPVDGADGADGAGAVDVVNSLAANGESVLVMAIVSGDVR